MAMAVVIVQPPIIGLLAGKLGQIGRMGNAIGGIR